MKYEIEISETALKELAKLDKPTLKKFDKAVIKLRNDPFQSKTEKLVNHPQASYRHRIGNWRILFDILPNQIIRIIHIWSRGKDYKK